MLGVLRPALERLGSFMRSVRGAVYSPLMLVLPDLQVANIVQREDPFSFYLNAFQLMLHN